MTSPQSLQNSSDEEDPFDLDPSWSSVSGELLAMYEEALSEVDVFRAGPHQETMVEPEIIRNLAKIQKDTTTSPTDPDAFRSYSGLVESKVKLVTVSLKPVKLEVVTGESKPLPIQSRENAPPASSENLHNFDSSKTNQTNNFSVKNDALCKPSSSIWKKDLKPPPSPKKPTFFLSPELLKPEERQKLLLQKNQKPVELPEKNTQNTPEGILQRDHVVAVANEVAVEHGNTKAISCVLSTLDSAAEWKVVWSFKELNFRIPLTSEEAVMILCAAEWDLKTAILLLHSGNRLRRLMTHLSLQGAIEELRGGIAWCEPLKEKLKFEDVLSHISALEEAMGKTEPYHYPSPDESVLIIPENLCHLMGQLWGPLKDVGPGGRVVPDGGRKAFLKLLEEAVDQLIEAVEKDSKSKQDC